MSKKSNIWRYFHESETEPNYAICEICDKKVSRGSKNSKSRATSPLNKHLENHHKDKFLELQRENEAIEEKKANVENNDDVKLVNLRTKNDRKRMIQATLPGIIEKRQKLDFNSSEAQKYHKRVFEMMLLDLRPFRCVNEPGFIRLCHEFNPRFELASDTYYRNLLEPTYDKIKQKVFDKIAEDDPQTFALSTDAWSSYHHSYLGNYVKFYIETFIDLQFCDATANIFPPIINFVYMQFYDFFALN